MWVFPKYCNSQSKGFLTKHPPKKEHHKIKLIFLQGLLGLGTCSFFLLKDDLKVGPWFKKCETKPVHSAQCRHVVVCTDQIRRKRTWESLLKTIWDWESQPYQVSNMNHTLSKLPIKLHLRVCQVCCCAGARIILLFFLVCRAPNCAPMRAFIRGFSCAKSCCMVSILLKVRALVITLFVL